MKSCRGAFTLFELILSIALSAALLALIGMAINLYLMRVDASRNRVEEAQLARSILTMIARDLRATAVYQPQDTSSIAQLMESGTPFDVDSIDDERDDSSTDSGGSSSSVSGGISSGGSGGSSGTGGSSASSSGSSSSDTSSSEAGGVEEDMPLGVSGSPGELYVDVAQLPRGNELFGTFTGYTNAPMAATDGNLLPVTTGAQSASLPKLSDLKTVRYFVRDGQRHEISGLAATSLSPELQLQAGGLVRQEVARAARLMADEMGDSTVFESGQVLIAPEVVHIEFKYYDGDQIIDYWDMAEEKALPLAVEVTIWLASPQALATMGGTQQDIAEMLRTAREYRQTVFLPMAEISRSGGGGGGGMGKESMSSSSSDSTPSGSSSTGSSFNQQQ